MNESNANGTSMIKYLCVKSIYAEPMRRGPYLRTLSPNQAVQAVSEATFNEPGYRIVKQNGDVSWKPKESFEKSAKPLPEGHNGLIIDVDPRDGSWAYVNEPSGCIGKNGVSDPDLCSKQNSITDEFISELKSEFEELNIKFEKLESFINSDDFKDLNADKSNLLYAKYLAMKQYHHSFWKLKFYM
jgi:hypothetical protein